MASRFFFSILTNSFINQLKPTIMITRVPKFSILSLFILAILLGCSRDKEEFSPKVEKIFFDGISEKSFSLNNKSDLNELSKALSKETKEIELLKDASLVSLKDSQGEYEAISVQYQVEGFITKLTVPLIQIPSDKVTTMRLVGLLIM